MTALPLAAAGIALLGAITYAVIRPAIRRTPHHATGPLAGRPYPLA